MVPHPDVSARTLFTIGHSVHPVTDFLDLLRRHGLELVVDVRRSPYSRRNPQFNREALQRTLEEASIDYLWLGEQLGGRVRGSQGREDLAQRAGTAGFRSGLERVLHEAATRRVTLMCAEKEPLDCHRTFLVCRHLRGEAIRIQHILADGSLEEHTRTEERLLARRRLAPSLYASREELLEEAYDRASRGSTLGT